MTVLPPMVLPAPGTVSDSQQGPDKYLMKGWMKEGMNEQKSCALSPTPAFA